MAEYRVHWEENGVVRYSWHPNLKTARQAAERHRRRVNGGRNVTGIGEERFDEARCIVRFELSNQPKAPLLEFLNEHCAYGPDVGPLRKPEDMVPVDDMVAA